MTAPLDWVGLEDALHEWVVASTGLPESSVVHVEPELIGASLVPVPAAHIQHLSIVPLGQREIRRIPSQVLVSVTVLADGPGVFAVNYYAGFAETPEVVTYTAGPGELAADIAQALQGLLLAALPVGYAVDIDGPSLAVLASEASPLFAMSSTDPASVQVTTLRERFPELECTWSRLTWRVLLRTAMGRGFSSATDLATRCHTRLYRTLQPAILPLGWRLAGVLLVNNNIPNDRGEANALLDFAVEGYATAAFQAPAIRMLGATLTT